MYLCREIFLKGEFNRCIFKDSFFCFLNCSILHSSQTVFSLLTTTKSEVQVRRSIQFSKMEK